MKPIGTIKTPFPQKFGIPRQGVLSEAVGELKLDPSVVAPGALDGLTVGDPVWLLFLFHQSSGIRKGKIKPPRLQGASLGIFASRSPHRPNPIGLSLCTLLDLDREALSLQLSGVDLLDGTPILDIKPYVAYADRPASYSKEHWRHQTPKRLPEVVYTDGFQAKLKDFAIETSLVQLAVSCAALDPRPVPQKDTPQNYWMQIGGFDFCFSIAQEQLTFRDLKLASESPPVTPANS